MLFATVVISALRVKSQKYILVCVFCYVNTVNVLKTEMDNSGFKEKTHEECFEESNLVCKGRLLNCVNSVYRSCYFPLLH